jgi:hypothetical protein
VRRFDPSRGHSRGAEALWWPPGKIVGRYLAPFLAERAELILEAPRSGVSVDVGLPELAPRC